MGIPDAPVCVTKGETYANSCKGVRKGRAAGQTRPGRRPWYPAGHGCFEPAFGDRKGKPSCRLYLERRELQTESLILFVPAGENRGRRRATASDNPLGRASGRQSRR